MYSMKIYGKKKLANGPFGSLPADYTVCNRVAVTGANRSTWHFGGSAESQNFAKSGNEQSERSRGKFYCFFTSTNLLKKQIEIGQFK